MLTLPIPTLAKVAGSDWVIARISGGKRLSRGSARAEPLVGRNLSIVSKFWRHLSKKVAIKQKEDASRASEQQREFKISKFFAQLF
jgi:hypothetical protein